MYTLSELESKTFGELKKIGYELNVLPAGDQRCRQTWIDAIAGVNPPLLQLLSVSAASVNQVQEPIIETVETSPGVEVEPVQKPFMEMVEASTGVDVDEVQDIINQTWTSWEKEYCAWLKGAEWCIHQGENKRILAFLPVSKTLRLEGMRAGLDYCYIWEVSECTYDSGGLPLPVCSSIYVQGVIVEAAKTSPGAEVEPVTKAIELAAKHSPGVDVEYIQMQLQEPLAESSPGACDCPFCDATHALFTTKDHLERTVIKCLHCSYSRPKNYPGAIRTLAQEAVLEKFSTAYPKLAAKPIAQNEEARPHLDRIEGTGVHNLGFHPTKSDRDSSGAKTEALGSQEGDRILAVSRDCETDRGRVLPDQSIKLVNLTDEAARLENEPIMSQSAIAQVAENSPGAEVSFSDRQSYWADRGFFLIPEAPAEPAENSAVKLFDGCPYCTLPEYESWHDETYRCYICEPEPDQIPIAQATENSPGAEIEQVQDWLPECCECFGDGYIEDESGLIKFCQCNTAEPIREKTQRAIAPEAKISLNPQSDRNPFLTGMCLSGRFLACYSPPQSESLHFKIPDGYKVDADGQLSLFEAQVVTEPEPPDPDDFESLDAFREAIARWDREHPSNFDSFSDYLPSSVHSEPPNPDDFDSMFAFWAAYDAWDEASDDDSEPLEVSIDSFCEWARCPADWYEPMALDRSSKVMEVSRADDCSDTSEFFIPTFGSLDDRSNRSDEPPDTGVFAYLPKPKPPNLPPRASWTQVGHKLNTSQPQVSLSQPQVSLSQPKSTASQPKSTRHPETIPKLFSRVAAGSSTQPARSPPGGDA